MNKFYKIMYYIKFLFLLNSVDKQADGVTVIITNVDNTALAKFKNITKSYNILVK